MALEVLAQNFCGECPCYGIPEECACMEAEAVLRCYIAGYVQTAMSPAQRETCLQEIEQVESFRREDYAEATDRDLARGVLDAWVDYCRDKGLL